MKVNFTQSFKDFKGKALGVSMADEIGRVLFNVGLSGNAPLTAEQKYMAYKLCNRMQAGGEVELTAEEAAFLLKVCGESLTAGAYGQVRDLIEC